MNRIRSQRSLFAMLALSALLPLAAAAFDAGSCCLCSCLVENVGVDFCVDATDSCEQLCVPPQAPATLSGFVDGCTGSLAQFSCSEIPSCAVTGAESTMAPLLSPAAMLVVIAGLGFAGWRSARRR